MTPHGIPELTQGDVLEAIREGVREAMEAALPTHDEVLKEIANSVYDRFPTAADVTTAIGRATEIAMGGDPDADIVRKR